VAEGKGEIDLFHLEDRFTFLRIGWTRRIQRFASSGRVIRIDWVEEPSTLILRKAFFQTMTVGRPSPYILRPTALVFEIRENPLGPDTKTL
jgi:hypothetical protein